MRLMHKREDGTFVVERDGMPYHVVPEDPIFAEVAAAASGVTLPPEPPPPVIQTRAPLPTPLQWMDRLPAERQAQVLDALETTSLGRLFRLRLAAATEIDPKHPDTAAGVEMLRAAGALSDAEAAALLA